MHQLPNSAETVKPKGGGTLSFAVAVVVGILTTFYLLGSFYRILTPADVDIADQAGRVTGGLFASLVIAGMGYYGLALMLYNAGMATSHPQTHSPQGKLQQIYDATKDVDVADFSEDGFYVNASENELVNFHRILAQKNDSSRFAALILEVRRRLGIQSDT